ncbi:MAG: hypothetical protein LKI25_01390 [Atopobiaceae bacterium]|nr:hypothetical protein [Atopobiaceae bacterium]MCI2207174.1 hypothetical protein [Atopobiaceae bacterium]
MVEKSGSARPLGVIAVAVAAALLLVAAPAVAWADEKSDLAAEQSDNSAQIAAAQEKATDLANQQDDLQSQLDTVSAQLTDTSSRLSDAQANVASIVDYQYRSGMESGFIDVVLSSTNWDDFVTRVTYGNKVSDSLTQGVADVRSEQDNLTSQKSQLEDLIKQMQQNQQDIYDTVQQLQASNAQIDSRLQQIADDERARQQAEEEAAAKQQASLDSTSTTTDASSSSAPSTAKSSSDQPDGTWERGLASAYDDVGQATAWGPLLDWTTPTVAVPMAWSNYRSFFGRYVEISYGGTTITARCTDCGYMNNGERSLDLSPGCYKALGYSEAEDWGVRTVSYRWL